MEKADSTTRAVTVVAAVMLLVACADLPYDYYTILRLLVTITSILAAIRAYSHGKTPLMLIYAALGYLYNPILPVHLEKSTWQIMNVLTALTMILASVYPAYSSGKMTLSHQPSLWHKALNIVRLLVRQALCVFFGVTCFYSLVFTVCATVALPYLFLSDDEKWGYAAIIIVFFGPLNFISLRGYQWARGRIKPTPMNETSGPIASEQLAVGSDCKEQMPKAIEEQVTKMPETKNTPNMVGENWGAVARVSIDPTEPKWSSPGNLSKAFIASLFMAIFYQIARALNGQLLDIFSLVAGGSTAQETAAMVGMLAGLHAILWMGLGWFIGRKLTPLLLRPVSKRFVASAGVGIVAVAFLASAFRGHSDSREKNRVQQSTVLSERKNINGHADIAEEEGAVAVDRIVKELHDKQRRVSESFESELKLARLDQILDSQRLYNDKGQEGSRNILNASRAICEKHRQSGKINIEEARQNLIQLNLTDLQGKELLVGFDKAVAASHEMMEKFWLLQLRILDVLESAIDFLNRTEGQWRVLDENICFADENGQEEFDLHLRVLMDLMEEEKALQRERDSIVDNFKN